MWSSVMNDDPTRTDARMFHEAKEVLKGTKYAANHWSELLIRHSFVCVFFCFEMHIAIPRT